MTSILFIAAVDAEARAIGKPDGSIVVAGGIGRTNAAAACTEAIIKHGPFDAVVSVGIAGVLPAADLAIGDVVAASSCVYVEEGLMGPAGFSDMSGLGFKLGSFEGNAVPVDDALLETFATAFAIGPIATVATVSGTDEAAMEVVRRTGAVAEAMEGAAVVHAAQRLHTPAIELRAISNTTGHRSGQTWDLEAALAALAGASDKAAALLRTM